MHRVGIITNSELGPRVPTGAIKGIATAFIREVPATGQGTVASTATIVVVIVDALFQAGGPATFLFGIESPSGAAAPRVSAANKGLWVTEGGPSGGTLGGGAGETPTAGRCGMGSYRGGREQ